MQVGGVAHGRQHSGHSRGTSVSQSTQRNPTLNKLPSSGEVSSPPRIRSSLLKGNQWQKVVNGKALEGAFLLWNFRDESFGTFIHQIFISVPAPLEQKIKDGWISPSMVKNLILQCPALDF